MRRNDAALNYFVGLLREGKFRYDPDTGEFWALWEPRRNWLPKPKLAGKRCSNRYIALRTTIKSQGSPLCVMAHRVAWTYCVGPIPDGYEINHKDGVKDNNRLENLEPVTSSRNQRHAFEIGIWRPARELNSGRGKLADSDVAEIRRLLSTGKFLQKELADFYGVRPNQISRIYTGQRRAA